MREIIVLLIKLLNIYSYIILIRVILSWVRPDPSNPIVRAIYQLTEPVLDKLRAVISLGNVGFDFSPILAFFLIRLIQRLLLSIL